MPNVTPNAVILGAGPAGIACALEASKMGFRPIILEKRSEYAVGRVQQVILDRQVLTQLEQFQIHSELWQEGRVFSQDNRGNCTVRLADLEQKMRSKLNIPITYEDFVEKVSADSEKVDLHLSTGKVIKCVDVIINAEGYKSSTNKLLSNRRIEVLKEETVVNSILQDDRPAITSVQTFCVATGKTMRNIAYSIYDHVRYLFLLIFTGEHFFSKSRQIALAITLKTPGQHQVSFAFTQKKTAALRHLQEEVRAGRASQKSLDNMLHFWTRMAQCEVNIFACLAAIGRLFGVNEPRFVTSSHIPIRSSTIVQIRSDKVAKSAFTINKTLVLNTGDALSAVDPSTGLGCNTGIDLARHIGYALSDLQWCSPSQIALEYSAVSDVLIERNHAIARNIRQLVGIS